MNRPLHGRFCQSPTATPLSFILLTVLILFLPMLSWATGPVVDRSELRTAAEYIEYASINEVDIHDLYFSVVLYEGTESCVMCHEKEALDMLDSGHFKWRGTTDRIVGLEGQEIGKRDLLNNFCIATDTNEGRCSQCHVGVGYADASFNFNDPLNVDCLVCHDQSGTYKKSKTNAGRPDSSVDLNTVARSVAISGAPPRKNCLGCHASAGGGDNVKHGDLSTDLVSTTREYDVHMGVDGANMDCVDCHGANHDPKSGDYNHGIAGMSLHSVYEGEMKQCKDCHGGKETIHAGTPIEGAFDDGRHERLACQVCHIPAIARKMPTKTEWYWADAGKDMTAPPPDPATGRPVWDKKKGSFAWANDVAPVLRVSDGRWNRKVLGLNDKYESVPIDLGSPAADPTDPEAMIYPFKMMIGNQAVDPVTKTVMVPHLFGMAGGPNPFWGKFNWLDALIDGAAYTGQDFSGTYSFEDTFMLLSVNHEIAPANMALGAGGMGGCRDCHLSPRVDWTAIGWTDDPFNGGAMKEGTSLD